MHPSIRLIAAAAAAAAATAVVAAPPTYALRREWPQCAIERPITVAAPPDGTNRQFLVQQTGTIVILPADRQRSATTTFLDVTGLMAVENDFEEGLVGFAFHPKFKENGRFFTVYAQQNPKINRLSEWRIDPADPNRADPASEKILLEIPRPFWNHNSGSLLFGPDGYLYLSVGDGGKRDDVARLSQNLFAMNGKILRLDVDSRTGRRAYGIPADNPYVKTEGVLPEIWCSGLRNPWGMAFDPATGVLWCADVGQDQFEEINTIVKGGNYGWSYFEGSHPFTQGNRTPPKSQSFIPPVHEYGRDQGISITGGFVYRGKNLKPLQGAYIYGDWGSGRIWALHTQGAEHTVTANDPLVTPEPGQPDPVKPSAFVEDLNQEILVLDWSGRIFSMVTGTP